MKMKLTNIIFLICFFIALVFGFYYLYKNYYNALIMPKLENEQEIGATADNRMYFSTSDKLYTITVDNSIARLASSAKSLILDDFNGDSIAVASNQIFFNQSENQAFQIKSANLDGSNQTVLVSTLELQLNTYGNLSQIRILKDEKTLIFLASGTKTNLFSYNLDENILNQLTPNYLNFKISNYAISPDEKEVVLAMSDQQGYSLNVLDLSTKRTISQSNNFLFIDKLSWSGKNIFFLSNSVGEQTSTNIYSYNSEDQSIKTITDLVSPNKIENYHISNSNKYITIDVINEQTRDGIIEICQIDGSNLMELTNNSASYFSIFNPKDDIIGFWQKNNGFYTINANKNQLEKIMSFDLNIDKIYEWR